LVDSVLVDSEAAPPFTTVRPTAREASLAAARSPLRFCRVFAHDRNRRTAQVGKSLLKSTEQPIHAANFEFGGSPARSRAVSLRAAARVGLAFNFTAALNAIHFLPSDFRAESATLWISGSRWSWRPVNFYFCACPPDQCTVVPAGAAHYQLPKGDATTTSSAPEGRFAIFKDIGANTIEEAPLPLKPTLSNPPAPAKVAL
jgi:hypothetical protein